MANATGSDALVGRTLDGRYRVDELIARGGMATVYRGMDTRLDRIVAMKVLSSKLVSDPGFVGRFLHEAKATASLTHPNVVAVHDQGVAEGFPYLIMEYVPGRTIREVLRENGPFTPAHALEVQKAVLSGLVAAHEAGFVHRDIKPENVLITASGHVKVTDFGLARVIDDTPVSDSTGSVLLGTMAYLSPEQVQQHALDERSDVYSAGILLFEMLTGRVPFTGTSPLDVAYQHVNQDVPAPSTVQPDVPPAIDHLVLAATRRNPNDRIQSAHSFLEGVMRAMTAVPAAESIDKGLPLSDTVVIEPTSAAAAASARGAHRAAGDVPVTRPVRRPENRNLRRVRQRVYNRRRVVVGAGAAFAVILISWLLSSFGARTAVPNVASLTQDQATAALTKSGFTVKVAQEFSESVAVGNATHTDPASGSRARNGSTITLFVSKGQERYQLPTDLIGMSLDDATSLLDSLNLKLAGTDEVFDDKVAVGKVASADPAIGESLKRGASVTLHLSKGPQPVVIPAIAGMDQGAAKAALAAVGLKMKIAARVFDSSPVGSVMTATPLPGNTVAHGSTVSVTLSKGPQTVVVPDLAGTLVSQASAKLKKLGFKVSVVPALGHWSDPKHPEKRRVVLTSPAAGYKAIYGSTVILSAIG